MSPTAQPNRPTPEQDLLTEIAALAETFTAVGPVLLEARPVFDSPIQVQSDFLEGLRFSGPAIDFGLLTDPPSGLRFLIPFNNDLANPQAGSLVIPPGVLSDAEAVYDLIRLAPVPGAEPIRLTLQLPPAAGHIYLLGTPEQFLFCKAEITRHRAEHAQRIANARAPFDALPATSVQWLRQASDMHDKTHHFLRTVGKRVGNFDPEIRNHVQLFEHPVLGDALREWTSLLNRILTVRANVLRGEVPDPELLHELAQDVTENQNDVLHQFETLLARQRRPVRVALLADDDTGGEVTTLRVWLGEHAHAQEYTPMPDGTFRDSDRNKLTPSNYDVIWMHQLEFARRGIDPDTTPAPEDVLWPALLSPDAIAAWRGFVEQGGGLLLTGISGAYATPLGLADRPPDRLRENRSHGRSFYLGMIPARNAIGHPALATLPANGMLLNANHSALGNRIPECAWTPLPDNAVALAQELCESFGHNQNETTMSEFRMGRGKVIVLSGLGVDYTPQAQPFSRHWEHRSSLRVLTLDTLTYLAAPEPFALETAKDGPPARSRHPLPVKGWRFRLDPDHQGETKNWANPQHNDAAWETIRVDRPWTQQQHADYVGVGWYRMRIPLPPATGQRVELHFGAVDEEAVVYLDGQVIGEHRMGRAGWDVPFSFDLTRHLAAESREALLAVRAWNTSAAGGIWKPVWLQISPANGDPSGKHTFSPPPSVLGPTGFQRGPIRLQLDAPDGSRPEARPENWRLLIDHWDATEGRWVSAFDGLMVGRYDDPERADVFRERWGVHYPLLHAKIRDIETFWEDGHGVLRFRAGREDLWCTITVYARADNQTVAVQQAASDPDLRPFWHWGMAQPTRQQIRFLTTVDDADGRNTRHFALADYREQRLINRMGHRLRFRLEERPIYYEFRLPADANPQSFITGNGSFSVVWLDAPIEMRKGEETTSQPSLRAFPD